MPYLLSSMRKAGDASAGEGRSLLGLVAALAVFVVVAGLLLAALSVYRRRMRDEVNVIRDFSLGDLRDLHRDGQLTDEEFERAKAKLIASTQAKLAREKRPTMAEKPFGGEVK